MRNTLGSRGLCGGCVSREEEAGDDEVEVETQESSRVSINAGGLARRRQTNGSTTF